MKKIDLTMNMVFKMSLAWITFIMGITFLPTIRATLVKVTFVGALFLLALTMQYVLFSDFIKILKVDEIK